MSAEQTEPEKTKKVCSQCNKKYTKDQFAKKQWKKEHPSCRLCGEFTKISQDKSRQCHQCQLTLPRFHFDIYQWGKGSKALCHSCRDELGQKVLDSINGDIKHRELADGTCVCLLHSLESCDTCMMDFTLPNQFARKRKALGRDLTDNETNEVISASHRDMGIIINRKICIMDGQPMCPRSGKKLRCPCDEVTYCSKACQKHHWTIHKMTCKVHAQKNQKKAEKAEKRLKAETAAAASSSITSADDLTEEQKNYIRKEAFFAENNGGTHSIEECAWQLGEHPLVIGGGSIRYGPNGEEFVKGDVAAIYRDRAGKEWDGSPRFGMGPYVQKKTPVDWIAKARQGKSQREMDLESLLLNQMNI